MSLSAMQPSQMHSAQKRGLVDAAQQASIDMPTGALEESRYLCSLLTTQNTQHSMIKPLEL